MNTKTPNIAVSGWLLAQPGIFRVWAVCDVENAGSARALEKARFQQEGILRRWIVHPNRAAEPRDCRVYALVK
jgi:[ribosomal protein S5]-alanine N-acetyltransferase